MAQLADIAMNGAASLVAALSGELDARYVSEPRVLTELPPPRPRPVGSAMPRSAAAARFTVTSS